MIKTKTIVLFVGFSLLMVGLLLAYINVDKTNLRYWYQDFTRKNEPYTLLLGSSSIDRMPVELLNDCKNPVVYGFNNGITENVDAYLLHANIEHASKVVLYIGENDIARGEKPEVTFVQFKALVNEIKSKTAGSIGLIKLKYSPARAKSHVDMLSFNQMLDKRYANDKRIHLIPFDEIMDTSWFIYDGVHLNYEGNKRLSAWINDFCRS